MDETISLLIERLNDLSIYDLERLRGCFEYELSIEPENRESLKDILRHISLIMDQKAAKK